MRASNADYIRSDQDRDIDRYREILADDYVASLPDLELRDKAAFLQMLHATTTVHRSRRHDVQIRLLGDFALIHGRVTFNVNGEEHRGRYTDTWQRREGRWLCIAADVISDVG